MQRYFKCTGIGSVLSNQKHPKGFLFLLMVKVREEFSCWKFLKYTDAGKKNPSNGIFINVGCLFTSGILVISKSYLKRCTRTHTRTHARTHAHTHTHTHTHTQPYLGGRLEQPLCLGAVHDTTQSLTDCRNGSHLILIWCIYEPNSPPRLSHVPL